LDSVPTSECFNSVIDFEHAELAGFSNKDSFEPSDVLRMLSDQLSIFYQRISTFGLLKDTESVHIDWRKELDFPYLAQGLPLLETCSCAFDGDLHIFLTSPLDIL
jgi:hypothetical protein